jgi:hypothetical protein
VPSVELPVFTSSLLLEQAAVNRASAVKTATATTVPRLVRVKFVRSFSV